MQTKYIFVTGGVLSSLGKGISSSSIATLIKYSNYKVSVLKIDPYINVDPGTISPLEHGEVFVTYDGAETDLDLGHYERFLNINLSAKHNFTTGQIYLSVIEKERMGKYLGKTIQIVPHIVDEIKNRIKDAGKGSDFLIVELGGTVGDIEGMPYLEALRQLKHELGNSRAISIHVTLIPVLNVSGEFKTKPTQHSVQELRRIGISPQIILARCEKSLPKEVKDKISLSCNVDNDCVVVVEDAKSIYKVPLNLLKENILIPISRYFNISPALNPNIEEWDVLVNRIINPKNTLNIALVGKYTNLRESYKSLIESLIHCTAHTNTKINIKWIDSLNLTKENIKNELSDISGMIVAGGFGKRGIEGKLLAIQYARENNIVFLGICLGMQLAIIEFCKNVVNIKEANSIEFDANTKEDVIYLIDDFIDKFGKKQIRTHASPMGGTMRLGEYECILKKGTKIFEAYKKEIINERHRHRYEANIKYENILEENGMLISGKCNNLIESIEIPNHNWFVGVQFHPEFNSKLKTPSPIILEFIKQAIKAK